MVMDTIGRKPGSIDAGWGETAANEMRGTELPGLAHDYWVHHIGIRAGVWPGNGPASAYLTLHNKAGAGNPTTLIRRSNLLTIASTMADRASGAVYEVPFTSPAAVPAGTRTVGGVRTAQALVHGQDMSGAIMYRDLNAAAPPGTFDVNQADPQGTMSIWILATRNEPPLQPPIITPKSGELIADTTPEISCYFRDPNETLPGFGLGAADKMSEYQVEVWNATGGTPIWRPGVFTATAQEQTDRRFRQSVAVTLAAGRYQARARVRDQFGEWTGWAIWTFTVNAGGTVTEPGLRSWSEVAQNVTTDTTPDYEFRWNHSSGLSSQSITATLRNAAGSVVRGPSTFAYVLAPGEVGGFTHGQANVGTWAALTPGQYKLEVSGMDSAGLTTPTSSSDLFWVNGAPNQPSSLIPVGGVYTAPPNLSAIFSDPNDAEGSLIVGFRLRPQGDTGEGVWVTEDRFFHSEGRWYADLTTVELPNYGVWEWSTRALDPWGVYGAFSPWTAFTYSAPPTVTITSPADDAVLTTSTNTISWTVSTSQQSYQRVLVDQSTGQTVYDSGVVTSAVQTHTLPAGILRNAHPYRDFILITTTLGLTGYDAVNYSISYVAPAALGTVTAEPWHHDFDQEGSPSMIRLTHPRAPIPEGEFEGYVYARSIDGVEEAAAERTILTINRNQDLLEFRDVTPRSGTSYRYDVSYLQTIGLDVVESAVSSAVASVRLRDTVISAVGMLAGIQAALPTWESRGEEPLALPATHETWAGDMVAYASPNTGQRIHGTFQIDKTVGSFGKTGEDLMNALKQLRAPQWVPYLDANGELRRKRVPTTICYRDPRGRRAFGVITSCPIDDAHIGWGVVPLVLTTTGYLEGVTSPEVV